MRYIKFTASTPYCGTDNERYVAFRITQPTKMWKNTQMI